MKVFAHLPLCLPSLALATDLGAPCVGSLPNGCSFVVDTADQGALTTEVTIIIACEGVGAITKQVTRPRVLLGFRPTPVE